MTRIAVIGAGRGLSAALALAMLSVADRTAAVADGDDLRNLNFRQVGVVVPPGARPLSGNSGKQKAQWKSEVTRSRR